MQAMTVLVRPVPPWQATSMRWPSRASRYACWMRAAAASLSRGVPKSGQSTQSAGHVGSQGGRRASQAGPPPGRPR